MLAETRGITLVAYTHSIDFPGSPCAMMSQSQSDDVFLVQPNSPMDALYYSGIFGGDNNDRALALGLRNDPASESP
jgi:hypothetical protein